MIDKLKKILINLPGWRTNSKVIVIESDDWGSIRSSSNKALEDLKNSGIKVDNCSYMQNDAIASNEDLELLFNILAKKNTPKITANFLTSNPDFNKIKESGFNRYYSESILETVKRYPKHDNAKNLWLEGKNQGFFYPQLHGREHLNIPRWLQDLKDGNEETLLAFKHKMFGVSAHIVQKRRASYQAALDGNFSVDLHDKKSIIKEAVQEFNQIFGFKPESFIAPNYIWDSLVEKALAQEKVMFLQGTHIQRLPRGLGEKLQYRRHALGDVNEYDQKYLVRNAFFEPSSNKDKDWVDSCLSEIKIAFLMRKPAIISSHRVNFVGFLNQKNRDQNLKLFEELIKRINKNWPGVHYLTTAELTKLIG
ncbi:polysaccharide (de)acetylase [Mesonia sp.]|uniref:polysaccharide (de)acetylase n=1 Tax=Mesonia sp. TaxID=1960830 RepID=UPI001768C592|nr:polysaccharide (de)acetylase [Mesonia sp.]HIB38455.1 polysaccharide (de)acetylase [Mesonia sp.]